MSENIDITSGQIVSGITINSGTTINVSSGGTVESAIVNASGVLHVFNAGTAQSTTVNSSGFLRVYDGGLVEATTLEEGGAFAVFSGGLASQTVMNAGWFGVYSGGNAVSVSLQTESTNLAVSGGVASCITIDGGGKAYITSEGLAVSTTIHPLGRMFVYSNGNAEATTVSSGGSQLVNNDGLAESTIVCTGALQNVYSGGTAQSTTVSSGGSQRVYYGGLAESTIVCTGGMQNVYSDGRAVSTTVLPSGVQRVSGGGVVESTIVSSGGTLSVFNGGVASEILLEGWGMLGLREGGLVSGVTVTSSAWLGIYSGGTAISIVLTSNGGVAISGGVASNITNYAGGMTVRSNGTAYSMVLLGGYQKVLEGGVTVSAVLEQRDSDRIPTLYVSSGGTAVGATVKSGGVISGMNSGTLEDTLIESGGTALLFEGASALRTEIHVSGAMDVFDGANAVSTIVGNSDFDRTFKAYLRVSSGGVVESTIVHSPGYFHVYEGGVARDTFVERGGLFFLGGLASNVTVRDLGGIRVYSGGTALETVLEDGGIQVAVDQGLALSTLVCSKGRLYVSSAGQTVSAIISSGGSMIVDNGGTATSTIVNPNGSLMVNGMAMEIVENGGYVDLGGGASATFASHSFSSLILSEEMSATVHSGTTAVSTTLLSGGNMTVFSGGTVVSAVVKSGGAIENLSGASISNLVASSGATLRLQVAPDTYIQGTYADSAFVMQDGFVEGMTLNSGCSMFVLSGGTALSTTITVSGELYVSNGGFASDVTVESGILAVQHDGSTCQATISSGGTLKICWNGKATSNTVYSGGTLSVESGYNGSASGSDNIACATSNIILDGGIALIMPGASTVQTCLNAGGSLYVSSGGNAEETYVFAGGIMTIDAGGNATIGWHPWEMGTIDAANGAVITYQAQDATIYLRTSSGELRKYRTSVGNLTLDNGDEIVVLSGGTLGDIHIASGATATFGEGAVLGGTLTVEEGGIYTGIDITPPEAPTVVADITESTRQNVTVSALFSEDSVKQQYSLDGQTWRNYTSGVVMPGNGTVYFRGIDLAGNISDVTAYTVNNIENTLELTGLPEIVTENQGRVRAIVTRTGSVLRELDATVTLTNGTGLVSAPATVHFAAGAREVSVTLTIGDNITFQGKTQFTIVIDADEHEGTSQTIVLKDDEKPTLSFEIEKNEVTEGESWESFGKVKIDHTLTEDLTVKLSYDKKQISGIPDYVVIRAGETEVNFPLTVINDQISEITKEVRIRATADEANAGSVTLTVMDNDLPAIALSIDKTTVSEGDGTYALIGTITRTDDSTNYVKVKFTDVDKAGISLPSLVTLGTGAQSVSFYIGITDNSLVDGDRTATVKASIYIDDCGCTVQPISGETQVSFTILDNDGPALGLAFSKANVAEGQANAATLTLTRNTTDNPELTVHLNVNGTSLLELPETVTFAEGETSVSISVSTLTDSINTGNQLAVVTASADNYASAVGYLNISDVNRPDFLVSSVSLVEETVYAGSTAEVKLILKNAGFQDYDGTVSVNLALANGTNLGTYRVNGPFAMGENKEISFYVTLPEIAGMYSIVATIDPEGKVTELDEGNNIASTAAFPIVLDYSVTALVEPEILYTPGIVTISGQTLTQSGNIIGGKEVSILISGTYAQETLTTTSDSDGNYSISYDAGKLLAGTYTVKAGGLGTYGEVLDSFTVAGMRSSTTNTTWDMYDQHTTQGTFTLKNQSEVALTGISISVVDAPENFEFTVSEGGTLAGNSSLDFNYTITANGLTENGNYALSRGWQKITFQASSDEGVTTEFYGYFHSQKEVLSGELTLSETNLSKTLYSGETTYFEFIIMNTGKGETGTITVSLPNAPYLRMVSSPTIDSLASGETATVTFAIDPTALGDDLALNAAYKGAMAINAENADGTRFSYDYTFVSNEFGNVNITLSDEYTYYAADKPMLAGATVCVYNAYTNALVATGITDENGQLSFENLAEGRYLFKYSADKHNNMQEIVTVKAGETQDIDAFLNISTVTYTWEVQKVDLTDTYQLVLSSTYESHVPAPVLTIDGPDVIPHLEYGETTLLTYTVTNHGLIAANDFTLTLSELGYDYQWSVLDDQPVTIAPNQTKSYTILVERPAEPEESRTSYEFDSGAYVSIYDKQAFNWGIYVNEAYQCGYSEKLLSNLQMQVGDTHGDFAKTLIAREEKWEAITGEKPSYNQLINNIINEASGLNSPIDYIQNCTDFALGTNTMALNLTRTYGADLESRSGHSSFGNGWSCNWDTALEFNDNELVLRVAGGENHFVSDGNGGYDCVGGCHFVFSRTSKDYLATHEGVSYAFDEAGRLTSITDGEETITCAVDELVTTLVHSNGDQLVITRNQNGYIVSASDGITQVNYSYDGQGNLIGTDVDGAETIYAYDCEADVNSLVTVTQADGTIREFTYNELCILNGYTAAGSQFSLSYQTDGGVLIQRDGVTIGTAYFDGSGTVARMVSSTGTVGGMVAGCALDTNGTPIQNLTISLSQGERLYSAKTGVTGAYSFVGLEKGFYNLYVSSPGYADVFQTLYVNNNLVMGDLELSAVTTGAYGTYSFNGRTDMLASVWVTGEQNFSTHFEGTNGSFSISGLEPGNYSLEILTAESAPQKATFTIEEGNLIDLGNFQLGIPGSIVVNLDVPQELEGKYIVVALYQNDEIVTGQLIKESGEISINGLEAGDYQLVVRSRLGEHFDFIQDVSVEAKQTTVLDVSLETGYSISGRLLDANGTPVKGVVVDIISSDEDGICGANVTDSNGYYHFDNLIADEYTLVLDNDNSLISTVTISNDAPADVVCDDYSLAFVSSLEGYLLDQNGQLMDGTVYLLQNGTILAYTDAPEGYYQFLLPEGGDYVLSVESTHGTFGSTGNISLTAGEALSRNLTLGGNTLNVSVSGLDFASLEEPVTYILRQLDNNGQIISVVTLETTETSFAFENLAEGNYILEAIQDNWRLSQDSISISGGYVEVAAVFEQLSELRVQIAELEDLVTLLLYDAENNLVDYTYFTEDGTAAFQALEAGQYHVVAFGTEMAGEADITIGASTTKDCSLELVETPYTLLGQITMDGNVASDAYVFVYDGNGRIVSTSEASIYGYYVASVAQPGNYTVGIRCEEMPETVFENITVAEDSICKIQDFELQNNRIWTSNINVSENGFESDSQFLNVVVGAVIAGLHSAFIEAPWHNAQEARQTASEYYHTVHTYDPEPCLGKYEGYNILYNYAESVYASVDRYHTQCLAAETIVSMTLSQLVMDVLGIVGALPSGGASIAITAAAGYGLDSAKRALADAAGLEDNSTALFDSFANAVTWGGTAEGELEDTIEQSTETLRNLEQQQLMAQNEIDEANLQITQLENIYKECNQFSKQESDFITFYEKNHNVSLSEQEQRELIQNVRNNRLTSRRYINNQRINYATRDLNNINSRIDDFYKNESGLNRGLRNLGNNSGFMKTLKSLGRILSLLGGFVDLASLILDVNQLFTLVGYLNDASDEFKQLLSELESKYNELPKCPCVFEKPWAIAALREPNGNLNDNDTVYVLDDNNNGRVFFTLDATKSRSKAYDEETGQKNFINGYRWSLVDNENYLIPIGSGPTLSTSLFNATSQTYHLTVLTDKGYTAEDTITVEVLNENDKPTADAGADKTYISQHATYNVTLSGSGEGKSGIAAYQWYYLDGDREHVVGSDATITVSQRRNTTREYYLRVQSNVGLWSDPKSVSITVVGEGLNLCMGNIDGTYYWVCKNLETGEITIRPYLAECRENTNPGTGPGPGPNPGNRNGLPESIIVPWREAGERILSIFRPFSETPVTIRVTNTIICTLHYQSNSLCSFADGTVGNYITVSAPDSEDDICAYVSMEFAQTAVMSREGFEGTLTIANTNTAPMENFTFTALVLDADGVDVSELFEIVYTGHDGFTTTVNGDETLYGLEASTSGQLKVVYVPGRNTAVNGAEEYQFTGTISYHDAQSGDISIDLTPITLTVNPSPALQLHYFVERDVYSDDPFTDGVEEAVPAEISVLVVNGGAGDARNFSLSGFTPTIVDNQKGLLLNYTMTEAAMNGKKNDNGIQDVNFGTIEAHSSAVAQWWYTANIQGHYSDYSVDFTQMDYSYVDLYGNRKYIAASGREDISLIESADIHELIRSVDAGDDELPDFLVDDLADAADTPDTLYLSTGAVEDVNAVDIATITGNYGATEVSITLTAEFAAGWNYLRILDPGNGDYELTSVSRDGEELNSRNFWQTDRTYVDEDGVFYEDRLHLLDYVEAAGEATYTLNYTARDKNPLEVTDVSAIDSVLHEALDTITVTFNKAVNATTFTWEDLTLYRQGQLDDNLIGNDITITRMDDVTFTIGGLASVTDEDGYYQLIIHTAGITDTVGNAGELGKSITWTMAANTPAITSITGIDELMAVKTDSVTIEFNTAINATTLTANLITVNGAMASNVVITAINENNRQFRIDGLANYLAEGENSLTIDVTQVQSIAGVNGVAPITENWSIDTTTPSAEDSTPLGSINEVPQSLVFTFSEAVSFDASSLTLKRNGATITADALNVAIDGDTATVTGIPAASADGDYELSLDMTQVTDAAGNAGTGIVSRNWTLDTAAPAQIPDLRLAAECDLGASNNDGMTSTKALTLLGTLPEAGLDVSIYQQQGSTRTLLFRTIAEGTQLHAQFTVAGGNSNLIVELTDAAGNSSESTLPVFVDEAVFSAQFAESFTEALENSPDSITVAFSEEVAVLTLANFTLLCDNEDVSLADCTLAQVDAKTWRLSGLPTSGNGDYTLSLNMSGLSKLSTGLAGSGARELAWTVRQAVPPTVVSTSLNAGQVLDSLATFSITFSETMNCNELIESGAISQAVKIQRLDGNADVAETILLDATDFQYVAETNTLVWRGMEPLTEGGSYRVILDHALFRSAAGLALDGGTDTDTAMTAFGSSQTMNVAGTAYAVPVWKDYNGDGKLDILVGEKSDNSTGKIKLYLNKGTNESPVFDGYTYLQGEDGDWSVAATACLGVAFRFADTNNDGAEDLVFGTSDGRICVSVRNGSIYAEGIALTAGGNAIDVGNRAVFDLYDWDGDGDLDIISGAMDGKVYLYVNNGDWSFATAQTLGIQVAEGRSTVSVADLNSDGLADIVSGDTQGSVFAILNNSDGTFSQVRLSDGDSQRSRPFAADANGDGVLDITVGYADGTVKVFYGEQGTTSTHAFRINTAPVFSDEPQAVVDGYNVTITWSPATDDIGIEQYKVKVGETVYTTTETSLELSSMDVGVYSYQVGVRDTYGLETWSAVDTFTVADITEPVLDGKPTLKQRKNTVTVSWNPAEDNVSVVGYRIELNGEVVANTTNLGYTLRGLELGDYTLRIGAYDAAGLVAWSETQAFTVTTLADNELHTLPYTMPTANYGVGCVSASVGMLLGYYDLYGYCGYDVSNLIDGEITVNSRGDAEALLNTFIASYEYALRFFGKTPAEELDATFVAGTDNLNTAYWNSLADWLGTGQYWRGSADYATAYYLGTLAWVEETDETYTVSGRLLPARYADFKFGLSEFANFIGYSLDGDSTMSVKADTVAADGFSFGQLMDEIDAGRGVLLSLYSPDSLGHMVVAYGYNEATGEVIFDDTTASGRTMVWDGKYSYAGHTYTIQNATTVVFDTTNLRLFDKTPPEITSIEADVTAPTNGKVVVTATATDNVNEVTLFYSKDGEEFIEYADGVEFTQNGQVVFKAVDTAGNETVSEAFVVSNIDQIAPIIGVEIDNPEWTNGSVTLTATFADVDSGIASMQYKYKLDGEWKSYTKPLVSVANRTVYLRAIDIAGNETTQTVRIANIDKKAPTIKVKLDNTEWTNGSVRLAATFADADSGIASMQYKYKLDGEWKNYKKPLVSVGNRTVYLRAIDNAGNETTQTVKIANIDKKAPTIDIELDNTEWTNESVTLAATFADADSGVASMQYKETLNDVWKSYTKPLVLTDNGTVYFKAVDNAGNETTQTFKITNIDQEAPTIDIEVDNTEWTNGSVTLVATFADADSGVASMQYKNAQDDEWESYTKPLVVTDNGTVYFKAVDNAGNETISAAFVVSNIDKNAPTINIEVDNTEWTNGSVTIVAAFADADSGIASMQYKEAQDDEWESYTKPLVVTDNGTIYFKAVDNAGNETISAAFVVSNIDKNAPTVDVEIDNTEWTNGSVTLAATFADADSGVASMQYKYKLDGEWKSYTKPLVSVANRTVYLRAVDNVGNETIKTVRIANIDKKAPTIDVELDNTEWTNGSVTLAATFADADSGVASMQYKYKLDGEWKSYTKPLVSVANRTIYLRAVDNVGNETTKTVKIANIDKKTPTIDVELDNTEWTNGSVTLAATFADADSGVASMQYKYKLDGEWKSYTKPLVSVANRTIYLRAIDNAGNETTQTVKITNIDKTRSGVDSETNDWLFGGTGDDSLAGDDGDELIGSWTGDDMLHDSSPNNLFAFGGDWGNDTVAQCLTDKVTLGFDESTPSHWNSEPLSYIDDNKPVAVTNTDNITLQFGNEDSELYSDLLASSAPDNYTSHSFFNDKGMLA